MVETVAKRRGRPPKKPVPNKLVQAPLRGPGRPRGEGLSWEDAIEKVLRADGGVMRYTDIANRISSQGYKSVANPVASVASAFTKSRSDENSRFVPMGNGLYALKDNFSRAEASVSEAAIGEVSQTGALKALGMFWQRDAVVWSGKPRLLGKQSEGASNVDFCEQIGVYLLHDRDRVIYVGRAADTLYARLKAHTTDRLGGRWDRFSWFGLRAVAEDGSLADPAMAWNHVVVIETLEALLIESLEPPLNRKRGDNFSGVEYLQVLDPSIGNKAMRDSFEELLRTRDA